MAQITTLRPNALPGGRYGSFAGREVLVDVRLRARAATMYTAGGRIGQAFVAGSREAQIYTAGARASGVTI